MNALLALYGLTIGYHDKSGAPIGIVRGLDLLLSEGETLGVVGESGCGKSTALLAMLGFLKPGLRRLTGTTSFRGGDLFGLTPADLARLRGGEIGFVPQSAAQSLTPTMRIGRVLEEALMLHAALPRPQWRARSLELLREVRFTNPEEILDRYPHELSGGQQQRIAIAVALAGEPKLLLLDEPTTALDVTTRAYILDLLADLRRSQNLAMIYVSHDLGVIARVADRIAVMYAGEIVEQGPTDAILRAPAHPYTHGLLRSIPHLSGGGLPQPMSGQPPSFAAAATGCAFADRCPLVEPRCRIGTPPIATVAPNHTARCLRSAETRSLNRKSTEIVGADVPTEDRATILAVEHLDISYAKQSLSARLLGKTPPAPIVRNVDLKVRRGEVLSLVGESGSGKSTILRVLAGLLPAQSGRALLDGAQDMTQVVEMRPREVLKQVQLVFQNPDDSLNPRQTIRQILESPLRLYFGLGAADASARALALLQAVRLGPQHLDRLPSQLSGGEKQRVAIARAFAAEPELLLCDEVTSALDVSVQAAVLALLMRLKRERDATLVFVSHDLTVVRVISDHVAILYKGELCEIGAVAEVFAPPFHPYTEALLSAVLEPDTARDRTRIALKDAPSRSESRGCPFAGRCPRQIGPICDERAPDWQPGANGHSLRCHIPLSELRHSQSPLA